MTAFEPQSILFAGLLMGMLHALDPDHVLTISSLGSRPAAEKATWRYALQWGVGHGGILILAALALLLFEIPMPAVLPPTAERLVGVIMIAAGGTLALALWRGTVDQRKAPGIREKAPLLIGLVHGTAGSAAVFALVPLGLMPAQDGVIYVTVFSLGVLVGMFGFGLGFDRLGQVVSTRARVLDRPLRGFVAFLAIGFGGFWLVGG